MGVINKTNGLLTVIASIITIIIFMGYPDISSIMNDKEFKPQFDARIQDVIISPTRSYSDDYENNINIQIEAYTPHLSKMNIRLINYSISDDLKTYFNYNITDQLPASSLVPTVLMEDYGYSIDEKHDSRSIDIPIEINHLWIAVIYTVYPTNFRLGNLTIQAELIDVERNDSLKKVYNVPIYWNKN